MAVNQTTLSMKCREFTNDQKILKTKRSNGK